MDYAERGTVEKTIDRLVENGTDLGDGLEDDLGDLVLNDEFTPEGRAYVTGVVSGVLATVRMFSEEDEAEIEADDLSEVLRIAEGRERDLRRVLTADD
jgi:hypothetical protein